MTAIQSINCPHCRKVTSLPGNPDRPFCSERCKTMDLGIWATGGYRVPGENAPQEKEEPGE